MDLQAELQLEPWLGVTITSGQGAIFRPAHTKYVWGTGKSGLFLGVFFLSFTL
jgi:hypothetical protein